MASQVYGVPLDEVTSEMRRGAKAVNFGVIYGQSPFGLAKQLDIEQAEAAEFIDAYFDRYPGVEEFLNRILEDCQRDGYVSTILGRRRAIQRHSHAARGRQRNLPERTAINTVIQGSAADLIKLAMIKHPPPAAAREVWPRGCCCRSTTNWSSKSRPKSSTSLRSLVAEEMAGVMPLTCR